MTATGAVYGTPSSTTIGSTTGDWTQLTTLGKFVIVSSLNTNTLRVFDSSASMALLNTYTLPALGITTATGPEGMAPRPNVPNNFLLAVRSAGVWELALTSAGSVAVVAARVSLANVHGVADSGSLVCVTSDTGTSTVSCYDGTTFNLVKTVALPTANGVFPTSVKFSSDGSLLLVTISGNIVSGGTPYGAVVGYRVADVISVTTPTPLFTWTSATYTGLQYPSGILQASGGFVVAASSALLFFPITAPFTTSPHPGIVGAPFPTAGGSFLGSLALAGSVTVFVSEVKPTGVPKVYSLTISSSCPAGFRIRVSSLGDCDPCPSNTFSSNGNAATTCTACPSGTTAPPGSASCVIGVTSAKAPYAVRVGSRASLTHSCSDQCERHRRAAGKPSPLECN